MKTPRFPLFLVKSPSYLLLLLSLTTVSYAKNENTRDPSLTQAQRFAAMKPRFTSMHELKSQKKGSSSSSGGRLPNKVTLPLEEALGGRTKTSTKLIRTELGDGPRTVITVDDTRRKKENVKNKPNTHNTGGTLRKKEVKSDKRDTSSLSKLSLALGQALNQSGGGGGRNKTKEPSMTNSKADELPQGL